MEGRPDTCQTISFSSTVVLPLTLGELPPVSSFFGPFPHQCQGHMNGNFKGLFELPRMMSKYLEALTFLGLR